MKTCKRVLSIVLTISMLLVLAIPVAAVGTFSDAGSITYKEAVEVMSYLGALKADGAFRPKAAITVEEAASALEKLGSKNVELTGTFVTGAQFLDQTLALLSFEGKMPAVSAYLRSSALVRGLKGFHEEDELTREQAAQILLNALQCKVGGNGSYLADSVGVEHKVIEDYNDPYNRPGSYWVKKGTNKEISGKYLATPVLVTGEYISWCDLLSRIGYPVDGTPDNEMKWFRNTENGGDYTFRFEKCHWDNNGSHGGCGNDYTNSNGQTLEVYELADHEYRNVMRTNFLAKVDDKGISLYGYGTEVWGPWNVPGLPAPGYYIVNYHWNTLGHTNAGGQTEGFEIVQKAKTIYGQLDGMETPYKLWINDETYIASKVYNLGYEDVFGVNSMPNYEAGKYFTYFLDQYGLPIGNLAPSDNPLPFSDVPVKSWFEEAVSYVYLNGIMNGTSTTAFSPNQPATRAMLVTMLWRQAGSPVVKQNVGFKDVPASSAYFAAVNWAAENKIVTGYQDNTFRMNVPVTREQLASILHRFAKLQGENVELSAELDKYQDADKISSYALSSMEWAVAKGLINGVGKASLAPAGTATRAQLAAILMRYLKK